MSTTIQEQFTDRIPDEELLNCMRCGFCLPACPTYVETQDEVHSPRGRIALMKAVRDGLITEYEEVEHSLNVCLGCRACEPACPAGVNYGSMLEEARAIFQEQKKKSFKEKATRKVVFDQLFPNQKRMKQATGLLSFYQRSGLQKVTRKIGFMRLFPKHLAEMEKALPKVPKGIKRESNYFPVNKTNEKTVAFFTGCLMDTMFFETNQSTIKLLQLAGCNVHIPQTQNCCGALHGHSGELEGARQLAKKNIEAFEECEADYIITNAGGCGAFLHDYDHLLRDEPEWKERAEVFASKITDFTSILVDMKFHEQNTLQLTEEIATYQDSCHLRNVMGVKDAPRKLIKSISNVTYQELPRADQCCGSAGIYNIVQPEMSNQILDHKMEDVKGTKAHTIVTTNPGCLLQMKLGIQKEGLQDTIRAVHLADYLIEALQEK
ncbi:glycolate oxidase iron-sulfur subunit [Salirhabdus euzebyi]|uniref:Glycolate oxidase iron-sulfur subunit n=1 Tax=Salirhabdus euzebyi TaxID=394506 RepID=A0A841PVH2_9BACI|nr:(Fe-S)-binding protein [Salirhabdus euzebyi]MBB6451724.1 glycolate oxidase iron-sulfur subunit [Salirhabdus euzebyi]